MQRTTHMSPFVGIGVCLLILLTLSVRCATALPSGLVAWWPGDSNANDLSGHGYNATLVNGAQAGVPGLIGGAFQFDGVAAFVSTPLLLPSQGTIDLWVKPAVLDSIDAIFGTFGISNGNDRLWLNARGPLGGLGVDPNRLVVSTGSCCVNEIVVPSPLLIGTWTHLALTFDYGTDSYALYINGSLAGTSTAARQTPTQLLDFGGHRSNFGQNFYWNGLIDEVHVFNQVLTPSEILELATPTENVLLTSLAPAILWMGLKNSDDEGTKFDVRTEVYINEMRVSSGITRCITGVTRNPSKAKEVTVPLSLITATALEAGDIVSLTVLTRIGTNPNDSKCSGHTNAVGLRLYYDAVGRPSRFGAAITPDSLMDFFLHSDGTEFLDAMTPAATTASFRDSSSLKFSGGNPWHEIGTWSMPLP